MIEITNENLKPFINDFAYIYYKALMFEDIDIEIMTGYLRDLQKTLGTDITDQIAKQVLRLMFEDTKRYDLSDEDLVQIFIKLPAFKTTFKNYLHNFLEEENDDRTNFTTQHTCRCAL